MDSRSLLIEKLQKRSWFKSSNKKIQVEIETDFKEGLLKLLGNIEDSNELGDILSLKEIKRLGEIVNFNFEVSFLANNEKKNIQTITWADGDNYLSRGVILIESEGKLSHFLLEKKLGLANFKLENQTFAMIYPDFTDGKIIKLPQRLAKALPNHVVKKYFDLGYVWPECNLVMAKTFVFAVVVSIENADLVDKNKVQLVPVDSFDELSEINDGYFLTIYSRLKFKGIL